jgi:L-2-hydroxycarboxylate dehydrogenase (NAD+)
MKVKLNKVKTLLISTLVSKGVSKENAKILAADYLRGELQGKYSHGLEAFPALLKMLPLKQKAPATEKETNTALLINAKGNFGAIVARKFLNQGIKKAKKQGMSMILIKDMLSWLRPGSIAEDIAEKGMVGFVINSAGSPLIAPPGGYEPRIGTNPIGIGIPTEGHSILVDMATSKRAWGEIRKAKFNNVDLPPETYLNNKGEFTLNPDDVFSVVAAGEYKGFALALFIEILTGSMLGMPMNDQGSIKTPYQKVPRGAMIMIIDPGFSTSTSTFRKKNSKLVSEIRHTKKRPGHSTVFVPGDRAYGLETKAMKSGHIEITKKLWETLNERP